MAKWKLTEEAVKKQIAKAKEQTREGDTVEPRATSAHYDPKQDRIVVVLSNGSDFRFPPSSVPELAGRSAAEINHFEISPSGRTLRWKELDADLSLPGLMMGIFGTKLWMRQLGRIGGQTTSPGKAAAARLNGVKGGRPAKAPTRTSVRAIAGVSRSTRRDSKVVGTRVAVDRRLAASSKKVGVKSVVKRTLKAQARRK